MRLIYNPMVENTSTKSPFQLFTSSIVILAGLFVTLSTGNNLTGRVIGNTGSISIIDLIIVLFGVLVLAAGIWMVTRKDFHTSVFER